MKPAIFVRIAIVICPAEGNKYLLDDVTYHPATSLNNSLNAKQRSQFRPSSSDQKVYRFKDLPFQRFTVSKIYRFKDLPFQRFTTVQSKKIATLNSNSSQVQVKARVQVSPQSQRIACQ
jgi:hypothetical protein